MDEEFRWITFSSVACSSIAQGTDIKVLSNSDTFNENSWESGRFAQYPVQIILRLDFRIQAGHVKINAKRSKSIPALQILIGDGLHGSFLDTEYHPAGRAKHISEQPHQIPINGFGSYLKLLFTEKPAASRANPFGQISLAQLKVWGRPLHFNLQFNSINEGNSRSDTVDRLLMTVGIPLQLIVWSKEHMDNLRHAPVDEQSRETLIELDRKRDQAFLQQDYSALKQLTSDLKCLYDVGVQLLQLRRELKVALGIEDYDTAIILKQRITQLEGTRDSIDALYETARYNRMIVMGMPTEAHMEMVNQLLEDERLKQEQARRLREEELDRERRRLEEEERRRQLEQERARKKSPPPKRPVQKKKPPKPEPEVVEDKFVYNDGDKDLDQYFGPRIQEAGGNPKRANYDILKHADGRKILDVIGVNLWSSIHSGDWRHRLAAFTAFLEFIEAPLLPKYQNDTRGLFRAAVELATISCEDRVLPVYLNGLKILLTAMAPPICDHKVTPKMINNAMRIFIPILLNKVSQLNYRARDLSMHTLIELFRHPHVRIGPLVDYIMNLTAASEGPVQKQPWRIIIPRLEILLHLLQEYGVSEQWSWRDTFENLLMPCLEHAKQTVRNYTLDIIIALYSKVGMEFRLLVDSLGTRLKPHQSKIIYNRMLEVDQNRQVGMPTIQEESELKKEATWSHLKAKISSLERDEGKKQVKKKQQDVL